MRLIALVIAGLVMSAAALPAAAECPYKARVAQSEIQNAPGSSATASGGQSRG